jgi:hypothetical protein
VSSIDSAMFAASSGGKSGTRYSSAKSSIVLFVPGKNVKNGPEGFGRRLDRSGSSHPRRLLRNRHGLDRGHIAV